MTEALAHRGPDDAGKWLDPRAGIALGHRRLAILDLSQAGHQPMASPSGRFQVTYNGEIYNYLDLRRSLSAAGHAFRSGTDTEVLVTAFEQHGVAATVERLVGQFAFAAWDSRERRLWLVRDRLGEKPLYHGVFPTPHGPVLLFGSELSALRAHPSFDDELDREALAAFLRFNYLPAPRTIHARVRKLPAGHRIVYREDDLLSAVSEAYWSADEHVRAPRLELDDRSAMDRLQELLVRSVEEKLQADVPVGTFLSGGVDSALQVALLRRVLDRPVRTFTVGFESKKHDESDLARETAVELGTEHTELVVTPDQLLAVVPCLPRIYDEPFADPSQIPTFLVSRLARQHVTVGISGDGGDELFAGYERYGSAPRRFARQTRFPAVLRRLWADVLERRGERVAGQRRKSFEQAAQLRTAGDFRASYRARMSDWFDPAEIVLGASEPPDTFLRGSRAPAPDEMLGWMLATDLATYLPDGLMVKTDRASMAVGLEVRAPLLDHRIVEFALRLPDALKRRDGVDKWLPRELLARYVPRRITERPKRGFLVPLAHWLRVELRDWAEELLDERALRAEGVLDPVRIRRRWSEHLSGREDWCYSLWSVLSYRSWRTARRTSARAA